MKKVILITGGTKGIGYKIAEYLLKFKDTLIVVIARKDLSNIKKNSRIIFKKCDFSKKSDVDNLIIKLRSEYDHFYGIINNVAFPSIGLLNKHLNKLKINKGINVNIYTPLMLSKFFSEVIKPKIGGVIINISGAGAGWSPGRKGKLFIIVARFG